MKQYCCFKVQIWPEQPSQVPELSEEDNECRKSSTGVNTTVLDKMLKPLLSRYSSLDRPRKSSAWLVHFKEYLTGCICKDPACITKGPLSVTEVFVAVSLPKLSNVTSFQMS